MSERGGFKKVSNYQRILIQAVIEEGSRVAAAEKLNINMRTLENGLYRAFKALKVNNISDAFYLVSNGIFSREEMQEKQTVQ